MKVFTGGICATNGYLLPSQSGMLCLDAPEGMADWIDEQNVKIEALLLTHGHFDHIWDAAEIAKRHGCPVYIDTDDRFMLSDPTVFEMYGFGHAFAAVKDSAILPVQRKGTGKLDIGGWSFQLFHIPGHSPGSVAFYSQEHEEIIGGDILFAGGIGRWDLPGGNQKDLVTGIQTHLMKLPGKTKVHPGHGPSTTIGEEAKSNPYIN